MGEFIAWLIAALAGAAALFGVIRFTRPWRGSFFKVWLRCLVPVLLLLPAPVPGFDGHYAPAFVVALFEAAFQRQGRPQLALGLLFVGILFAAALAFGQRLWQWVRGRRAAGPKRP